MILSGLSLWEKGSPLYKSTAQVRTQGRIRHADCRQRKLADFLCTRGIIQFTGLLPLFLNSHRIPTHYMDIMLVLPEF
ncbi:hypothetical protein FQ030_24815 [Escherichia coli]|nr:hypothetical protein [Escherichia coli]